MTLAAGRPFTEVTMQSRRQVTAGLILASGVSGALAQSNAQSLAERFASTLSAHDIDAFAALFSESYVNHQVSAAAPAPAGVSPKQGSVAFFKARLTGLPDLTVAIEALVADKDRVAASFVYTGTHRGLYFGVAPTGRALRFTSCDIFRVQGDEIVEHWGMGDIAGVLAQLRA
jgi:predicted ester cyclase